MGGPVRREWANGAEPRPPYGRLLLGEVLCYPLSFNLIQLNQIGVAGLGGKSSKPRQIVRLSVRRRHIGHRKAVADAFFILVVTDRGIEDGLVILSGDDTPG